MNKRIPRPVVAVLFAVVLLPGAASAQGGELFGGFAYSRDSLGPITVQPVGFIAGGTAYLTERFGLTGELSWGRDADRSPGGAEAHIDMLVAMGGVRYRLPNDSRITPSLKAVAGVGRTSVEACVLAACDDAAANTFTIGLGGAVDVAISRSIALRVQPDLLLYDFEDAVLRFSAGLSFGF